MFLLSYSIVLYSTVTGYCLVRPTYIAFTQIRYQTTYQIGGKLLYKLRQCLLSFVIHVTLLTRIRKKNSYRPDGIKISTVLYKLPC
jgi:hypothetical protein